MKEIEILFSVPKQWQWWPISFAIRFFQEPKSLWPFRFFNLWKASHVAIRMGDTVTEAVFHLGTRQIPYKDWLELNQVIEIKSIPVTEHQYEGGELYLKGSVGLAYPYLELVGILMSNIYQFFFKKKFKGNPIKSLRPKKKCSEIAYDFLCAIGVVRGFIDPNLIDPRELYLKLWNFNSIHPEE